MQLSNCRKGSYLDCRSC